MTVAEIRAAIGDAHKALSSPIPRARLLGPLDAVKKNLEDVADILGASAGTVEVAWDQGTYGRYNYRTGGYEGRREEGFILKGTRPYTDAELEAEGEAIIKKIEKAEAAAAKKRAKKVAAFNKLARELGTTTLEV